jgi:hypothetical protein
MWGKDAKFFDSIYRETGVKPKALEEKTDIFPDMQDYYEAYQILSLSRQRIFGEVQRLQIGDMITYANEFKFSDVQYFIRVMQELDTNFLSYANDKGE